MKNFTRKAVEKMTAYTPGEQPKVRGLIKLNTNENPYPPSPKVFQAVRKFAAGDLRLYPDPVSLELREAIARYHGCKVEQVFVGNGSDEVLALCTRAFVEPSGTIGYFEPSYSLYPVLAAIQDVKTKPVRLKKDFSWTMPKGYNASASSLPMNSMDCSANWRCWRRTFATVRSCWTNATRTAIPRSRRA